MRCDEVLHHALERLPLRMPSQRRSFTCSSRSAKEKVPYHCANLGTKLGFLLLMDRATRTRAVYFCAFQLR